MIRRADGEKWPPPQLAVAAVMRLGRILRRTTTTTTNRKRFRTLCTTVKSLQGSSADRRQRLSQCRCGLRASPQPVSIDSCSPSLARPCDACPSSDRADLRLEDNRHVARSKRQSRLLSTEFERVSRPEQLATVIASIVDKYTSS